MLNLQLCVIVDAFFNSPLGSRLWCIIGAGTAAGAGADGGGGDGGCARARLAHTYGTNWQHRLDAYHLYRANVLGLIVL